MHEPEYISKGRFEKFMTDRKEGRLKDPQTSIMLIAFKKSLSGFEKVKLLTLLLNKENIHFISLCNKF